MLDSETVRWTSLEEVCVDLLPHLLSDGPGTFRAARLLASLAPSSPAPSVVETLGCVVADREREPWLRLYCLRALARVGGPLSPGLFRRLLDDTAREPTEPWVSASPRLPPAVVLSLARRDDEIAAALEWLVGVSEAQYAHDLAPMPDGSVVVGKTDCLIRIESGAGASPLRDYWGLATDGSVEIPVASQDGSAIFVFDTAGRHLRTEDARSGATLLTFGYDSEKRLTSVSDPYGNVTTIERPASGSSPIVITAPFGQETTVVLDANGMLQTVTDPIGGAWTIVHDPSTGRLSDLTDPLSRSHHYEYEPDGTLRLDRGAGAEDERSELTLASTDLEDGHQVTTTSVGGLTTAYQNRRPTDGPHVQTRLHTDGLTTTVVRHPSGSVEVQTPQLTSTVVDRAPDPRFGIDSLYVSRRELLLPGGQRSCRTASRTYDRESGDRTQSVTMWEAPIGTTCDEATTTTRRTVTAAYDASTHTTTSRSPVGRVVTTTRDTSGRPITISVPGVAPLHIEYDARGRVWRRWQSDSAGRVRDVTIGFDDENGGYVDTVTNADGDVVHFTTNAFGDVESATAGWDPVGNAPGADAITTSFEWDAMGNLSHLTPPGQPVHTMGYTPRDEPRTHATPLSARQNCTGVCSPRMDPPGTGMGAAP